MQYTIDMLEKMDFKNNRIVIDYFDFSTRCETFESVIDLLGLDGITWVCKHGVNGYQYRYEFEGIILHVADEDSYMFPGSSSQRLIVGVRVEMKGEGCRTFEHYGNGNWQKLINYVNEHQTDVSFNRVDLAYDDFLGILDLEAIEADTLAHNYVSKWRSDPQILKSIGVDEVATTVTHGRLSSDAFIRFYNKRLEQQFAKDYVDHWVRAEIMLRHKRALNAVILLADQYVIDADTNDMVNIRKPLNELYFFILNNYLRFIVPSETDSNRWRAPMAEHWKRFANSVTEFSISLFSKDEKAYTPDRLCRFVEKMAGSAIYSYLRLYGVEKLLSMCREKLPYLNPKYQALLEEVDNDIDATGYDLVLDHVKRFKKNE